MTTETTEMQAEIGVGLAGVAQALINIGEGHTEIEAGSPVYRDMEQLMRPEVANLLNAAPELLAALSLALPALAMHTPDGARGWPAETPWTENDEPDLRRIAEIIRAAIAKATGEGEG